jgi:hypothetical protein
MTAWQTVRHRVTLAGRVTNGRSGDPAIGVSVRLVKAAPALALRLETLREIERAGRGVRLPTPDRTSTAADGSFFFLDLPAGDYEVAAESGAGSSLRRSKAVSVQLIEPTEEEGVEGRSQIPHVELTLKESR